jgi:hypothetical protein
MKKFVILSTTRDPDSVVVQVKFSLNGKTGTVAIEHYDDHSHSAVYRAVLDRLDHHFYPKDAGIDFIVRTHHDEDHQLPGEFTEQKGPPWLAEALIQLLAPKKTVQHLLGDLQEMYKKNFTRFGKSRAGRLYWAQVLRSIGPDLWRRVKKLGLIAFLIDYGRSKFGW